MSGEAHLDPGLEATNVTAWRVIWRDRYGHEWVVDHLGQATPRLFKKGEKPRPLAGLSD